MDVYVLIGSAGTGKSHHAMEVAEQYQIDYIIDDGLLIHNGKKLAGISAKTEKTMVAAVKRAIFLDPNHAQAVKKVLEQRKPKKILILGTSEHMIDRIITALSLPPVKKIIFITDIVTKEELEIAEKMRKDGKHVIPLPSIEVKKDFPSYWIDPLMDFFRFNKKQEESKSIVRPTFSQYGKVVVNDQVVVDIVNHIAERFPLLDKNLKTNVRIESFGVTILCETKIKYGSPIQYIIMAFQEAVAEEIEYYTGLNVTTIDIRVTGIFES